MKKMMLYGALIGLVLAGCGTEATSENNEEEASATSTETSDADTNEDTSSDENSETADEMETSEDSAVEESTDDEQSTEKEYQDYSESEKQDIILTFINEDIVEVVNLETEANSALQSVSGPNFTNDQDMYVVLVDEVIPTYEQATAKAEALEPEIEELEQPIETFQDAIAIFNEALMIQKEALENTDPEMIEESNVKGMEYLAVLDEYHAQMTALAEEFDIEYEVSEIQY